MDLFDLRKWSRRIDGGSRIFGLIGKDIQHTSSPMIHNYTAQKLGINAVYLPMDIGDAEDLNRFFDLMWNLNAIGFNVTTPYKKNRCRTFSR